MFLLTPGECTTTLGGTKSFAKALFPAIMAALERLKSENKKLEGENERLRRTADGVEDLHQKGGEGAD